MSTETMQARRNHSLISGPLLLCVTVLVVAGLAAGRTRAKLHEKPYGGDESYADMERLPAPPTNSSSSSSSLSSSSRASNRRRSKLMSHFAPDSPPLLAHKRGYYQDDNQNSNSNNNNNNQDDICKYDWCQAGEDKPICVVYFTNYHRAFTLRNQKCVDFNTKCVQHLGTMSWCHDGRCYDDSIKFCNPPD